MTRWSWIFVAGVVCIASALLFAPEATRPACQTQKPKSFAVDKAELEDLTTIAKDEGISVKKAVWLYGWQSDFSNDVDCLQRKNRNTYSFADAGYPPSIRFKGKAPDGVQEAFRNLPLHVKVVVDATALYSAREMDAMQDLANDAAEAVVRKSGDIVQANLDEETGAIAVDLGNLHGAIHTKPADVKSDIESALKAKFPDLVMPKVTVRTPKPFPLGIAE